MVHAFSEIMFTPSVQALQERFGSRESYRRFEADDAPPLDVLGESEAQFISARDSFYMASVSETGWPYVQHRGGPPGFLKVLDERTIGFADFRGNRQYVSTGNILRDERVSLILMDYPNRRRLKLLGRAHVVDLDDEPELIEKLEVSDYRARVERGFLIHVEAFDWNCPQHITPRFTEAEMDSTVAGLQQQLDQARFERDRLLRDSGGGGEPIPLGNGPLELVITGMRQLSNKVRSYELRASHGQLPAFSAGAHLTVPVRLENGELSTRSYSLCSDPADPSIYEIAVQREDNGFGGSKSIHRDFSLGTHLRCHAPGNAFLLHADARPAILIAGGIGITPIKAMVHELRATKRCTYLHYAVRDDADRIFGEELKTILGEKAFYYDAQRRLDVAKVLAGAPDDAVVYACGPDRLTSAILDEARSLAWSNDRIQFEHFSKPPVDPNATAFEIVLDRSGRQLSVATDETALEALERANIAVPSMCRAGNCGTCVVKLKDGTADHRDHVLTEAERRAGDFIPCVSRAHSRRIVLDL